MPSELWEQVQVTEVKVGETVKAYDGSEIIWTEKECVMAIVWNADKVFRRHTGHHPDVLMRALKIALKSWDDDRSTHNHISWWIDKAEAEIAEERKSNE